MPKTSWKIKNRKTSASSCIMLGAESMLTNMRQREHAEYSRGIQEAIRGFGNTWDSICL